MRIAQQGNDDVVNLLMQIDEATIVPRRQPQDDRLDVENSYPVEGQRKGLHAFEGAQTFKKQGGRYLRISSQRDVRRITQRSNGWRVFELRSLGRKLPEWARI